jgi:hypothetical protein
MFIIAFTYIDLAHSNRSGSFSHIFKDNLRNKKGWDKPSQTQLTLYHAKAEWTISRALNTGEVIASLYALAFSWLIDSRIRSNSSSTVSPKTSLAITTINSKNNTKLRNKTQATNAAVLLDV